MVPLVYADLSCSIQQTCTGLALFTLTNGTGGYKNAHASLSDYSNILCCSSTTVSLSSDCSQTTVINLHKNGNAHVQGKENNDYSVSVCLSSTRGEAVCYTDSSCVHTCVASLSSTTNAHVGPCDEYQNKVCCNIRPKITAVYTNTSSIYRTQTIRIFVNGTDDEASENLTANISIRPSGLDWYVTNATMTYLGSDQWYYDFTPDKNNETGYYDVEVYLKEDQTQYGYGYNLSTELFLIINNKPIIQNIFTNPPDVVIRGNPITIYCNVSDLETPEANMSVNISVKHNSSEIWNIFENISASWSGEDWYITWSVPSDAQTGYYTVKCDAVDEDNDTGTSTSINLFQVRSVPKISNPTVSPMTGGWAETFDFSVIVEEDDGDDVNVTLWLNKTGTWEAYQSYICSNCVDPTQINFTTSFACADMGTIYYKFTADDNNNGQNETVAKSFVIEANDVSAVFTDGNETRVGTRGPQTADIVFTVSDQDTGQPGAGLNVTLYIDKDGSTNTTFSCTTNSTGSCLVQFDPDCSYTGGWHMMWVVVENNTCYKDTTGTGRIYIDTTADCENQVTFVWDYGDTGNVGGLQPGYYGKDANVKRYICLKNTTTGGVSGIVFSGETVFYTELTGTVAKISQVAEGNRIIIPIIHQSCDYIDDRMEIIEVNKFLTVPFISIEGKELYVELAIDYENIDITNDKTAKGSFVITFTKGSGNRIMVT